VRALTADVHHGPLAPWLHDWTRLYAAQPEATPFMSPGWAEAWWPQYARDADGFFVAVRSGREVVGLAALVRWRRGPVRVLEPVGMEPGDYWDVLAMPERRGEVADAVVAALMADSRAWDALVLRCLPPDSPFVAALDRADARSLVRPPILAPAIELPADFDAYLRGLPADRRRNLRRHLRRLDSGEVELREVTDPAELPAALARWQDFRRRQWESAGKAINPEHLSPRFGAFVLDCVLALVPRSRALVWEFRHGGEVVGTYVNFVDEAAFYWYLGGFDPRVASLGLGKIAIGHGIRTSIEQGRGRYDFARGAEPYKYWYGAVDRHLAARVVGSRSARSRLALIAARAAIEQRARSRSRR
jgi:CelD/BcsL family acetyltransferase involved in cellulose biosynthesis